MSQYTTSPDTKSTIHYVSSLVSATKLLIEELSFMQTNIKYFNKLFVISILDRFLIPLYFSLLCIISQTGNQSLYS